MFIRHLAPRAPSRRTSSACPSSKRSTSTPTPDFAKIALATDHLRPSEKPETWDIGGFIAVSVVLGVAMLAEALVSLWFAWSRFGLATNNNALYTFSFLTLLYFAAFSIVSARERRWFWATMPSKILMLALLADDLTPLPWWQMLSVLVNAMVACLAVNDALKVAMIAWHVPAAPPIH
jgi:hypothetical protein